MNRTAQKTREVSQSTSEKEAIRKIVLAGLAKNAACWCIPFQYFCPNCEEQEG